jgi:hypothetical protein
MLTFEVGGWIEAVVSEECVLVTCQNRKFKTMREVNGPLDVRRLSGEGREFSIEEIPSHPSELGREWTNV